LPLTPAQTEGPFIRIGAPRRGSLIVTVAMFITTPKWDQNDDEHDDDGADDDPVKDHYPELVHLLLRLKILLVAPRSSVSSA
jgi:hypothetical protein